MSMNDPFIFDEVLHPHIHQDESTSVREPEEEHPLHDDLPDRESRLARFDEQVLVMIAITAAPARWLWKKARRSAFEAAMQQVKFYLGPSQCVNCPEHNCEFSMYCRFLQQLLRL